MNWNENSQQWVGMKSCVGSWMLVNSAETVKLESWLKKSRIIESDQCNWSEIYCVVLITECERYSHTVHRVDGVVCGLFDRYLTILYIVKKKKWFFMWDILYWSECVGVQEWHCDVFGQLNASIEPLLIYWSQVLCE